MNAVLDEIGASDIPVELVLNKIDRLDPLARRRGRAPVSPRARRLGADRRGTRLLRSRIAELFSDRFEDVRLLVPMPTGVRSRTCTSSARRSPSGETLPEGVRIRARLPRAEAARFARFLVADEPELEASAR